MILVIDLNENQLKFAILTIVKYTTVHPWCDGHSTSISACGV